MKLRVLGSSGSVHPGEHTAGFLIGDSLLLEAGSVASVLPLEAQGRIRDVLLTHPHLDHVRELPFLAENVVHLGNPPIRVRGTADCLARLRTHLFNNAIWPDFSRIPSIDRPVITFEPLPETGTLRVGSVEVTAVPVDHPGGGVGYLLRSPTGAIAYSGDTGNTGEFWARLGRLDDLRGLLVETSFPDEMESIAEITGHLTPARLAQVLHRAQIPEVPIHVCHIKSPFRERVSQQLADLADTRIHLVGDGSILDF